RLGPARAYLGAIGHRAAGAACSARRGGGTGGRSDARPAESRRRLPEHHRTRIPGRPGHARERGGRSMRTVLEHTGLLTARALRGTGRVPVYMVMNLVQPMFWLLLFGSLFSSVIDIPGFAAGGTYLEFITPGIVMMTAMFGAAWAGTTFVQDMERGVMDRFLTSPTSQIGRASGR